MSMYNIGLIGLAVMGQNLALNMIDNGFSVSVYNRTINKLDEFISANSNTDKLFGAHSIEELINSLEKPRKIILMVKAGKPVDDFINNLLPFLDQGDIIIDGGNSNYNDTIRRSKNLESKGFLFIGTGISGGEEGARFGPSIMPGGSRKAWEEVKDIFQTIAAKVEDGSPCCDWVGANGAGHYVKMVHNGIEYGDMQLITEAYYFMKELLGLQIDEIAEIFITWNKGKLNSYLIEITGNILKKNDEDGTPLVEKILDVAGQKGTGIWTVISSAELGIPVTLIGESVYQRCLSALKADREVASTLFRLEDQKNIQYNDVTKKKWIDALEKALYASKIISYSQGFLLLKEAAKEFNWNLNYGSIALMWRGGCIIRSIFLGEIKKAFDKNPALTNLIFDKFFKNEIKASESAWREIVLEAIKNRLPIPGFSSSLAYFDSLRTKNLPTNLIQAQRDYFGAHGYERVDAERGKSFHTNWFDSI
ncbi:MAG: decarboxylating NADP(+)-dependent phosphogluconate dehydrogenase [Candidatus Hodarchaeales archaeon]